MITGRLSCCREARTVTLMCVVLSRGVARQVIETGQLWSIARAQSVLKSGLQGTCCFSGLVRQCWAYCEKQKQYPTYSCSPATNLHEWWVGVRTCSVALLPFVCSDLRLDSVFSVNARPTASGTSVDARAVVSLQQLQEMMEQTVGRTVDEFSRRSRAGSSAAGPDIIALDFTEGFVLHARSVSGYSRGVSWMRWRSVCNGVPFVCVQ